MDFNDATALMRLVQAVENDPYVMRRNWAAGTPS